MTRLSSLARKIEKLKREVQGDPDRPAEPVPDIRVLSDSEVDRLEYLIRKMRAGRLEPGDLPESEEQDYRRLMGKCLEAGAAGD